MKNLIILILCFLTGNIYSAVDLSKGKGDTVFIRDVKDIEQTVRYDSAGYRSSPTTIYWTVYKVIDTVFMDSVAYRNVSTSLIIDALNSRDTIKGETEKHIWYQRKDLFSWKYEKTIQPVLLFNEKEKTILYEEKISFSKKGTLWKTGILFLFFFIGIWVCFDIGKDSDSQFHKPSMLDNPKSFIAFCFLVSIIGVIGSAVAGLPRFILYGGITTDIEMIGYDSTFWWTRAGIMSAIFLIGYIYYYFDPKNKEKPEEEKPDSIPDNVAGSE